jgi:hypothetical protein
MDYSRGPIFSLIATGSEMDSLMKRQPVVFGLPFQQWPEVGNRLI